MNNFQETLPFLCEEFRKHNRISPENFVKYDVKRGLRNADGSGVMAGLTQICNVHGYVMSEGEQDPIEGRLIYRGVDITDLVAGCQSEGRFGYEEVVWLLLIGQLPTATQLADFTQLLSDHRELPPYFAEDVIMRTPSPNVMNQMARSVLALYSYDDRADDISMENVLCQSIRLMGMLPSIMACAYQVKRRQFNNESMFLHPSAPGLSTAETILYALRANSHYTREEALLLDLCLMLHAEHGGGNNSTFAARVLSSSGTDTYAAISAAIGSLKGPRHGGANIQAMQMLDAIKAGVRDYRDDDEIASFLCKLIHREAGDRSGLIYGMGHAVYTLSDPRAVLLKSAAAKLAEEKGLGDDFRLLNAVERLTPAVFAREKESHKFICANVDLYSGLVYRILGINEELFTPLFAVARLAGWCAHRLEEILTGGRIIRPAYKAIAQPCEYVALRDRI